MQALLVSLLSATLVHGSLDLQACGDQAVQAPDDLLWTWVPAKKPQPACLCGGAQHKPALQQLDLGLPTFQWREPNQPCSQVTEA